MQDWCSSAQTDSYPLYIRLEPLFSSDTGVNTSTYHFSAVEQPDTLLIGFWAVKKMVNGTLLEIALWQKFHYDDEQHKEQRSDSWPVSTNWTVTLISDIIQRTAECKFYRTLIELEWKAATALGFDVYTLFKHSIICTKIILMQHSENSCCCKDSFTCSLYVQIQTLWNIITVNYPTATLWNILIKIVLKN